MKLIKRIAGIFLRRFDRYINSPKLNILKTIYFNFRTMPFSVACQLPVLIYGPVKLYDLSGNVEFRNTAIRKGMVRMGRNVDLFSAPKRCAMISIGQGGRIIFYGPCFFSIDYCIRINSQATVSIGEYAAFGGGIKIWCENSISIGKYTAVTFEGQILDTNFHYLLDTQTSEISRKTGPVSIGAFNWIGNRTVIMKNTKTPDYATVASLSLLNKDYSTQNNGPVMLAGCPAKIVSVGKVRVYSFVKESEICNYFIAHPQERSFQWNASMEDKLIDYIRILFK